MSENDEIHLTEYKCIQCNKIYASQSSLCNHNKKFHKPNVNTTVNKSKNSVNKNVNSVNKNVNSVNTNVNAYVNTVNTSVNNIPTNEVKYSCKKCNKIFNCRQGRYQHEKRCNVIETNEMIIKKLKEENEMLKKNNQIIPSNNTTNSHNNTNNINNGTSNINNGTSNVNNTVNNNHNNTVTINKIGTEPIVFKTKDIKKIANDGMNGPITCARQLNFNKNKPQNHSYCITSLEGDYCKAINHETQQPEIVSKKEVIDQVFESAYRFITSVAAQIKEDSSLREKLTKEEIKEINRIVSNKSKFYEKNNRKTFYNSINSMGYNYKELVLTTWKLLKPLEENLIENDDSSDSEYDYTVKEVTEFPNVNEISDDDSDEERTIFDLIK